jgi:putative alpha-1,2-mannosidase
MSVNGSSYTKNYITHEALVNGANISYKMSESPNVKRGTEEKDFPYSFSKEIK